jgi:hypothetical protein
MKHVKPERLWLKNLPELSEKWIQERIAEDPSILGLGDLEVRDKERIQPRAGRLDLLLQDVETDRRYEVELQLGRMDESHIIRTLEYWDLERKRYPHYDHCAVLIAEEVTGRFLNVLSLFNGHIPVVALQMTALRVDGGVALLFTKVMDEVERGPDDDGPGVREATDRAYWEQAGSKASLAIVDEILELVREVRPGMALKYNKFYIGLAENDRADNFVSFRPRKAHVMLEVFLDESPEIEQIIEGTKLEALPYDKRWHRYRLRVQAGEVKKEAAALRKLINLAAGKEQG